MGSALAIWTLPLGRARTFRLGLLLFAIACVLRMLPIRLVGFHIVFKFLMGVAVGLLSVVSLVFSKLNLSRSSVYEISPVK